MRGGYGTSNHGTLADRAGVPSGPHASQVPGLMSKLNCGFGWFGWVFPRLELWTNVAFTLARPSEDASNLSSGGPVNKRRSTRTRIGAVSAVAVLCGSFALAGGAQAAVPTDTSELRDEVTVAGVTQHLTAFQRYS